MKDEVYKECDLNKSEIELKFSYLTHICDHIFGPIYLSNEKSLHTYLLLGDTHHRSLLHVEIGKKFQSICDNNVEFGFGLHGHDGGSDIGLLVHNDFRDDFSNSKSNLLRDNDCPENISDDCGDYANTDLYPDDYFDDVFIVNENMGDDCKKKDVGKDICENVNRRETQSAEFEFHEDESIYENGQNSLLLGSNSEQQVYCFNDESNWSVGKEFESKKVVQR